MHSGATSFKLHLDATPSTRANTHPSRPTFASLRFAPPSNLRRRKICGCCCHRCHEPQIATLSGYETPSRRQMPWEAGRTVGGFCQEKSFIHPSDASMSGDVSWRLGNGKGPQVKHHGSYKSELAFLTSVPARREKPGRDKFLQYADSRDLRR